VPFTYDLYARADAADWAEPNTFKKAFSNDVHIDFMGVWETVDSVGLIPKRLPFTTSNTVISTFRHAVSLDERRAKFKANLWNFPNDDEKKLGTHTPPPGMPTFARKSLGPKHDFTLPKYKMTKSDDEDEQEQIEFKAGFRKRQQTTRPTDILEVWFAGCHTDVGGGSVRNHTRHSLARIPRRWMIRECFKADTGIMFNAQRLQWLGLDPSSLYPFVLPRPPPLPVWSADKIETIPPRKGWLRRVFCSNGKKDDCYFPMSSELKSTPVEKPAHGTEEEEDLRDALQPIHDQLALNPFWWILELIPLIFRYQKRNNQWVTEFRANMGRPRVIPRRAQTNIMVHRSVKTRLEARDAKGRHYVNRAQFHEECVGGLKFQV
ncbi:hypothetical protein C8R45DRAFT_807649, partial [Mycena sanguinolenta]